MVDIASARFHADRPDVVSGAAAALARAQRIVALTKVADVLAQRRIERARKRAQGAPAAERERSMGMVVIIAAATAAALGAAELQTDSLGFHLPSLSCLLPALEDGAQPIEPADNGGDPQRRTQRLRSSIATARSGEDAEPHAMFALATPSRSSAPHWEPSGSFLRAAHATECATRTEWTPPARFTNWAWPGRAR
jgi:hypothetical protein